MRKVVLFMITVVLFPGLIQAQSSRSIAGAWERTMREPPNEPAFIIFSADGYFSQTILPANRAKGNIRDLTREELLARYEGLVARRGTYQIEGNRLIRRDVAHHNPDLVGRTSVQLFRIEDEMLILSSEEGIDTEWYLRMEPFTP